MRKNKAEEEKKNLYHKEYGVWSNAAFMLRRAIRYDKGFWWMLPLGVLLAPVMQYLWTFISKYVIDLITGEGEVKELAGLIVVFVLVQVLTSILFTLYDNEFDWRCINVRLSIMNREKNYKAMKMAFEYLEDSDVMDCYNKAGQACAGNLNGVEGMLHHGMDFLRSLGVVICGVLILGTMNPWVVAVMLLLAALSFLHSNHTNATAKKTIWDPLNVWWRKSNYMQSKATDFDSAKDIRMFHLKDWFLKKYHEINLVCYEARKKDRAMWLASGLVSNVSWMLAQVVIYYWLISSVVKGKMTIGNFTLYLASAETFFQYINTLLYKVMDLFRVSREVDDFRSYLDFDSGDRVREGLPVPEAEQYEFVFENVSFRYPKAEAYALKNVNVTLRAGERLAVVGLNGAGKSTFIKLLLRLYEPTEGTIYLNGVDIKTYNRDSYYKVFAPAFQEVCLFAFPLAENISMKPPMETDKELARVSLIDAGFAERLAELPKGVDTEVLKIIDEEGVDFSGGEKQKIALARALYKEAPVIVLDEPTAALDALAESKLYQDFDKLIGGKTAVYISHRLSSTQFCDRVAMFVEGELVEYGTHQELLAIHGAYAKMFEVQAQYYIEEAIAC